MTADPAGLPRVRVEPVDPHVQLVPVCVNLADFAAAVRAVIAQDAASVPVSHHALEDAMANAAQRQQIFGTPPAAPAPSGVDSGDDYRLGDAWDPMRWLRDYADLHIPTDGGRRKLLKAATALTEARAEVDRLRGLAVVSGALNFIALEQKRAIAAERERDEARAECARLREQLRHYDPVAQTRDVASARAAGFRVGVEAAANWLKDAAATYRRDADNAAAVGMEVRDSCGSLDHYADLASGYEQAIRALTPTAAPASDAREGES